MDFHTKQTFFFYLKPGVVLFLYSFFFGYNIQLKQSFFCSLLFVFVDLFVFVVVFALLSIHQIKSEKIRICVPVFSTNSCNYIYISTDFFSHLKGFSSQFKLFRINSVYITQKTVCTYQFSHALIRFD